MSRHLRTRWLPLLRAGYLAGLWRRVSRRVLPARSPAAESPLPQTEAGVRHTASYPDLTAVTSNRREKAREFLHALVDCGMVEIATGQPQIVVAGAR